jgi:hypothetical protein
VRKNPPSFPGDGFFDEEVEMPFPPRFEFFRECFRIWKGGIIHNPDEIFSRLGLRVPRNVVENLPLDMDQAALYDGIGTNRADGGEDCRTAVGDESFDVVSERIPEDFQVADDFFLPLFFRETEPYGLSDPVRALREQHFPSGKGVPVDHQAADAVENLVDVADRIPVQAALDVGAYEMFRFSRLVGHLPDGITFGNVLPEPIFRTKRRLGFLSFSLYETVSAGITLHSRVPDHVLSVLFKSETGTLSDIFFRILDNESYGMKLHDGFILRFWLQIQEFSSKTARNFFYLPKFYQNRFLLLKLFNNTDIVLPKLLNIIRFIFV